MSYFSEVEPVTDKGKGHGEQAQVPSQGAPRRVENKAFSFREMINFGMPTFQ